MSAVSMDPISSLHLRSGEDVISRVIACMGSQLRVRQMGPLTHLNAQHAAYDHHWCLFGFLFVAWFPVEHPSHLTLWTKTAGARPLTKELTLSLFALPLHRIVVHTSCRPGGETACFAGPFHCRSLGTSFSRKRSPGYSNPTNPWGKVFLSPEGNPGVLNPRLINRACPNLGSLTF